MQKIAFIVSHPIQYYAPLHRALALRDDVAIKVFFTWHDGSQAQQDHGFGKSVAWDIPLTEGYEYESVPNTARQPGTHHFMGLQNPALVQRVLAWQPDVVHLTGYAYSSHLRALYSFHWRGLPVLFRGDSHLLDGTGFGLRGMLKRALLSTVYRWPAAFLCVGLANRAYYRHFGVPDSKLFDCPHSIETSRFAEPHNELEQAARNWRRELRIKDDQKVVLFAGKFEDKKQPLPLMQAFLACDLPDTLLLLVGDGLLGGQVQDLADRYPARFRVLPFQNQSRMPLVYRLGDILVLPSAYGETWGLAVNEAMACGRPALVSDRVGCHPDVIRPGLNGDVFAVGDWAEFQRKLSLLLSDGWESKQKAIHQWAQNWAIQATAMTLVRAARQISL